ncbi:MAG: alpha/beta fold hydrolase [Bacteroidia bacterium]|nr:alpha/beta fold hydrolase [Bacteroidia bacterium]MDW8235514.1 alpha/beta fold hydrolase [Bacteroidia bacterium]
MSPSSLTFTPTTILQWKTEKRPTYAYAWGGKVEGPPVILVHGLFGALSNWEYSLHALGQSYSVYVPFLPVHEVSAVPPSLVGLTEYLWHFYEGEKLPPAVWIGNSLGGHLALRIARQYPQAVRALVLTGSSGLFEDTMGSSFPRRSSREYVAEKVRYTFYDPRHATPELIDEVYNLVNDNAKALRILKIARDAQREFVGPWLKEIQVPVCLIWGLNDTITPVSAAYLFYRLLPQAQLHFIDACGHAPMMEQPEQFHNLLIQFLRYVYNEPT